MERTQASNPRAFPGRGMQTGMLPSRTPDLSQDARAGANEGLRTPGGMMQLQRSAGNRAVMQLLAPVLRQQSGKTPVIQRKIEEYNFDAKHDHALAAQNFAKDLDDAVDRAWTLVVSRPLEEAEIVDGYTARWAEQWKLYASDPAGNKHIAPLVPAMVGYAIESIATKLYAPTSAGGLQVKLQASRGNTRPDIVLVDGDGKDVAWFDITADESKGHIKGKIGSGWDSMPFVLEFLYPSVSADLIFKNMVEFQLLGKTLSTGDTQERYWKSRALWEAKEDLWRPQITEWVAPVKGLPSSPSYRRAALAEILRSKIDASLEPKDMAAILRFCGLSIETYGYRKTEGGSYYSTPVTAAEGAVKLQEFEDMLWQPTEDQVKQKLQQLQPELAEKIAKDKSENEMKLE